MYNIIPLLKYFRYGERKRLDTRDLFPETPEGIVKENPTLQTIGDLNLSQFFERRSDGVAGFKSSSYSTISTIITSA